MERFRSFCLLLFMFFGIYYTNAQQNYSLTDIESKLSQNPKNIVIKFYADWCSICAIQSRKIEKNEELRTILERDFYFVEFNTESEETVSLNGIRFENKESRIHSFAETLLENPNALPAWVILNPDYEIIFQFNGLIEPNDLIWTLNQIP